VAAGRRGGELVAEARPATVALANYDPDPVQGDYRVSVIDAASNREVATVPVGVEPTHLT
jgi:YVTN family beta-propeller protein